MTVCARPRMETTAVDHATAVAIEVAEACAWIDSYAAAPAEWAESAGLATRVVAGAALISWAATGRRYFSRTIGLGVVEPVTPAILDHILQGYADAGIRMFLLQSLPHCRPAEYEGWLAERGLEPFDAHDRLVRGSAPLGAALEPPVDRDLVVERVGAGTADEWAEFVQRVYRLDTGPSWLQGLIGRPGWHQYVARDSGEIVAARAMYLDPSRIAWLGMDGPVPGVMTLDYAPDAALCEAIVADGLERGARLFHTDIEAPSDGLDTPAYEYFARLGFRRPYTRTHWRLA